MNQEDTHAIVRFASGPCVFALLQPSTRVKAVRRAWHGDWRTQFVRKQFMGMEEGQEGDVVGVFDNFDGRWCRVSFDGKTADIAPRDLALIPAAQREEGG